MSAHIHTCIHHEFTASLVLLPVGPTGSSTTTTTRLAVNSEVQVLSTQAGKAKGKGGRPGRHTYTVCGQYSVLTTYGT